MFENEESLTDDNFRLYFSRIEQAQIILKNILLINPPSTQTNDPVEKIFFNDTVSSISQCLNAKKMFLQAKIDEFEINHFISTQLALQDNCSDTPESSLIKSFLRKSLEIRRINEMQATP